MTEKLREIISPEGIPEKVMHHFQYLLTKTEGGKFRIYSIDFEGKYSPMHEVFDTLEEGRETLGMIIAAMGGLLVNPKETISALMEGLKGSKE